MLIAIGAGAFILCCFIVPILLTRGTRKDSSNHYWPFLDTSGSPSHSGDSGGWGSLFGGGDSGGGGGDSGGGGGDGGGGDGGGGGSCD